LYKKTRKNILSRVVAGHIRVQAKSHFANDWGRGTLTHFNYSILFYIIFFNYIF